MSGLCFRGTRQGCARMCSRKQRTEKRLHLIPDLFIYCTNPENVLWPIVKKKLHNKNSSVGNGWEQIFISSHKKIKKIFIVYMYFMLYLVKHKWQKWLLWCRHFLCCIKRYPEWHRALFHMLPHPLCKPDSSQVNRIQRGGAGEQCSDFTLVKRIKNSNTD